jgi:predicted CoA-binding protein
MEAAVTSKSAVDNFTSLKRLAVVGISRNPKKFGNYIYKNLSERGFDLFPVHPEMKEYEGVQCHSNLVELTGKIDGVVINIPPENALAAVKEADKAGIKNIWLQQGSSNEDVIEFCKGKGLNFVHGECIIMFTEPVESFHKFHRFIWKLIGKYPK